jgi:hypothetical protein
MEIKKKQFKGLNKSFCYRQISVTGGSVGAGFNCRLLNAESLETGLAILAPQESFIQGNKFK